MALSANFAAQLTRTLVETQVCISAGAAVYRDCRESNCRNGQHKTTDWRLRLLAPHWLGPNDRHTSRLSSPEVHV
jgi:hypothetical protein